MRKPLPGDMVMKRVEWFVDSHFIGTIIGYENNVCIVMWQNEDGTIRMGKHVPDALRVVDDVDGEKQLQRRRWITI